MRTKNNLTAVINFYYSVNFLFVKGVFSCMDGRIFQLQKQLSENLEHHWTVQKMAEVVKLSSPHFQKLFKDEVGISPIAWIREKRLEKARELIQTKFWQMKQIGIAVGMPNDSHLSRDFKKKYGVTPTEYRKQYWDNIQTEKRDK